jgi:hypothetical protein
MTAPAEGPCPEPDCEQQTTYNGQGGSTGPVQEIFRCPDGHEVERPK